MYTKVRRVLNTIRLEFILNVMLIQQFRHLVLMFGVVLRVTFVGKIQAISEELIEIVHSGKFLSLSDVRSMDHIGGQRNPPCDTSPTGAKRLH